MEPLTIDSAQRVKQLLEILKQRQAAKTRWSKAPKKTFDKSIPEKPMDKINKFISHYSGIDAAVSEKAVKTKNLGNLFDQIA